MPGRNWRNVADWLVRWLWPLAVAGLLGLTLLLLHHELRAFHYRDIRDAVRAIPASRTAWAFFLTVAAYAALPGYDAVALAYVGHRLSAARTAFASFIAYALSQTLGFHLLTGGSVRARFWSLWGLSAAEIASAVSFASATFVIGLLFMAGLALLLEPAGTARLLHLPFASLWPLGLLFLVIVGAYIWWSLGSRRPLTLLGWTIPVPSPRLALAQLGVAAVDWVLAAGVLYVLLPSPPPFGAFLGAFLLAQLAGLVSHVPGGLGVFDTLMVLLLAPHMAAPQVVSSLLLYRVVYYFIPFGIGLLLLAGSEVSRSRTEWTRLVGRALPPLVPYLLGGATFAAGVILLLSGSTPPVHSRIASLQHLLPLGVIEASHFAASAAGAGLIVLGWALTRRIDAAWLLTAILLALGIVASLTKGLDWEEAVALGVVLTVLLPSRRVFYRKAALTGEPFSPEWVVAIACVLGVSLWIGFFSFRHVEYSSQLWWRFTLHGDAPRFLRASAGVLVVLGSFGFARLLRHAPVTVPFPGPAELERVVPLVRDCPDGSAGLALLGDKALLFDEENRGVLMYGVAGRAWVSMGDPVGTPEARRALAWRFRELADAHGGWTAFYEVGTDDFPIYIDLGLTLRKIGEEAIVPLDDFSLDGPNRRGLRRRQRDVQKEGGSVEVIDAAQVKPLLPELRRISDDWLESKRTREKGFSLGRFDEDYLCRFPMGLVRVNGRIVGFANLWSGHDRAELSPDLMRYSSEAPVGVMEFMLTELMLWARAQGYRSFNLGMAPLAGFEERKHVPLWTRAGALLYKHGEQFYNFQGLRTFKEKWYPEWHPRYIASPGGLAFPRVLTGIATLIAGGLRGVVAK